MTDKNEFKAADLVFEISIHNIGLVALESHVSDEYILYGEEDSYTTNGQATTGGTQMLFHATPENYAKLYSVWGDAVPKLPPSESIHELLKEGAHSAC